MSKNKYLLGIIMRDHQNDTDGLLKLIIAALRSDDISKREREYIADMLESNSSKTKLRLRLARRPGNRRQIDDKYFDRLDAFGAIYDSLGGNEKEALDLAELPKEDGGIGVSRPTAKKYLNAWRDHLLAQQEARDAD